MHENERDTQSQKHQENRHSRGQRALETQPQVWTTVMDLQETNAKDRFNSWGVGVPR